MQDRQPARSEFVIVVLSLLILIALNGGSMNARWILLVIGVVGLCFRFVGLIGDFLRSEVFELKLRPYHERKEI
jgi:Kef-type K+ transport system membrane component KefB